MDGFPYRPRHNSHHKLSPLPTSCSPQQQSTLWARFSLLPWSTSPWHASWRRSPLTPTPPHTTTSSTKSDSRETRRSCCRTSPGLPRGSPTLLPRPFHSDQSPTSPLPLRWYPSHERTANFCASCRKCRTTEPLAFWCKLCGTPKSDQPSWSWRRNWRGFGFWSEESWCRRRRWSRRKESEEICPLQWQLLTIPIQVAFDRLGGPDQ